LFMRERIHPLISLYTQALIRERAGDREHLLPIEAFWGCASSREELLCRQGAGERTRVSVARVEPEYQCAALNPDIRDADDGSGDREGSHGISKSVQRPLPFMSMPGCTAAPICVVQAPFGPGVSWSWQCPLLLSPTAVTPAGRLECVGFGPYSFPSLPKKDGNGPTGWFNRALRGRERRCGHCTGGHRGTPESRQEQCGEREQSRPTPQHASPRDRQMHTVGRDQRLFQESARQQANQQSSQKDSNPTSQPAEQPASLTRPSFSWTAIRG
jgi:hypothetical protein